MNAEKPSLAQDETAATPAILPRPAPHELLTPITAESDNLWLLSYIDLFTLLVVMFVVMLTFSAPLDTPPAAVAPTNEPAATIAPPAKPLDGAGQSALAGQQALLASFQRQLAGLVAQGRIEISADAAGISLQLEEQILFDSGAADLLEEGERLLTALAPALDQSGQSIAVEGHTDDRPIATSRFPSNWELSGARATRVVRYLIELGIPARRLSAIGYADTRPVSGNHTPEGRARNRRVTLLVMPATAENEPAAENQPLPLNELFEITP